MLSQPLQCRALQGWMHWILSKLNLKFPFFYFRPSLLNPAYYGVPWEKFYSIHSNQQFKDGHDLNRKKLNMKVGVQQGDPASGCGKQAILSWSHLRSGCSSDFNIATRTIFSVSKGDSVQTAVVIKNCSDFWLFPTDKPTPFAKRLRGLKIIAQFSRSEDLRKRVAVDTHILQHEKKVEWQS